MATPTCTQFFFYKVKPFVTPEEPENHEGRQFLASLRQITAADVCLASSWGKVQEQEALICLAIGLFLLMCSQPRMFAKIQISRPR